MKLINKTKNGQLFFCKCCNTYQMEFGNLFVCFPEKEFQMFQRYVAEINGKKSVEINKNKSYKRKIFLSFPIKNIYFCLHWQELEELQILLFIKEKCTKNCSEVFTLSDISIN
jgi:hypothetical protein